MYAYQVKTLRIAYKRLLAYALVSNTTQGLFACCSSYLTRIFTQMAANSNAAKGAAVFRRFARAPDGAPRASLAANRRKSLWRQAINGVASANSLAAGRAARPNPESRYEPATTWKLAINRVRLSNRVNRRFGRKGVKAKYMARRGYVRARAKTKMSLSLVLDSDGSGQQQQREQQRRERRRLPRERRFQR